MPEAPEVAQIVSRLRAFIDKGGLSVADIADRSGVDEKIIRLIRKGDGNPTINTLEKLEKLVPGDWQPPAEPPSALDAAD